jgi:rubrerythrin
MSHEGKVPQTSAQWWEKVKNDKDAFIKWLKQQVVGESEAARRINELRKKYAKEGSVADTLLERIASDEFKHALWVKKVILTYLPGVDFEKLMESVRYWDEVEPNALEINTLEYSCAVAAHAEAMRLERIKTIAADDAFGFVNPFIQKIFQLILADELFHEEAFRMMAGPEALEQARANHHRGMEALGLVI